MSNVLKFQNILNDYVFLKTDYKYRGYTLYSIFDDLSQIEYFDIESALALGPKYIIVTISGYQYGPNKFNTNISDYICLDKELNHTNLIYNNWKIKYGNEEKTTWDKRQFIYVDDIYKIPRKYELTRWNSQGINSLLSFIKLILKWRSWNEYDLFIDSYQLKIQNLLNELDNIWLRSLLSKNYNNQESFSNFIAKIKMDDMYESKDMFNNYFFIPELESLNKELKYLIFLSSVKIAHLHFLDNQILKSKAIYDYISKNYMFDSSWDNRIVKILNEDYTLINNYCGSGETFKELFPKGLIN